MDLISKLLVVISITTLLISAFGVYKKSRKTLLTGICLWSVIPIYGEMSAYFADGELFHLGIAMAFVGQVLLTLPTKNNYTAENEAATALGRKIGLTVLVTNLLQGLMIVIVGINVPHLFGYFHFVACLILLYPLVMSKMDKGYSFE